MVNSLASKIPDVCSENLGLIRFEIPPMDINPFSRGCIGRFVVNDTIQKYSLADAALSDNEQLSFEELYSLTP